MNMDKSVLMSLLAANVVFLMKIIIKRRKARGKITRKRSVWCKEWLTRRCEGKGILNLLNSELRTEDVSSYNNFLRLCEDQVDVILNTILDDIKTEDTSFRNAIPARSKLQVTLRFLATGETFRSLMYSSRIHESTISKFVPIVCDAIIKHFKPIYLSTPPTVIEWENIAKEFEELWQFPLCLGALDGRHVTFRAPISDGSYYYNYKGTNSLVLLALADAKYKFTYVNVGVNGRISDGGVFHQCNLYRALKSNNLNFPADECLPGRQKNIPYVIIADDAFPLLPNLIKPYPQRGLDHDAKVYNYRLSRARRIIESSFGILANRFRVLLNPINLSAEKVEKIILTCVILHNLLCKSKHTTYTELQDLNQKLVNLPHLDHQGGNRSAFLARSVRDEFKAYFNSPAGAVEWQEAEIKKNNL